ncbi:hypothetical protein CHU98_g2683 [Xylaria longipes]|nr:hypothetical protein CHU98_g2683 [Xylaria longipes]
MAFANGEEEEARTVEDQQTNADAEQTTGDNERNGQKGKRAKRKTQAMVRLGPSVSSPVSVWSECVYVYVDVDVGVYVDVYAVRSLVSVLCQFQCIRGGSGNVVPRAADIVTYSTACMREQAEGERPLRRVADADSLERAKTGSTYVR